MAELLDPTRIDELVSGALGTKPQGKSQARQQSAGPNLSGLDEGLAKRLEEARAEYKRLYGKDLPITSGVRTRAEQQKLFEDAQRGKPGVFMPINPADHPGRETFHADAVDISTAVPEDFLNKFGIHRPLGKKDPVHAVLMPGQQQSTAAAPSNMMGMNEDLFKPENIDAAVKTAVTTVPTKVKGKTGKLLSDIGTSATALADTGINAVTGTLDYLAYPFARAYYGTQMSPEQAAEKAKQETTSPKNIIGQATGVANEPAYKGEASQQLVNFIGENVGKGVDWLAEKTGLAKPDIESYVNSAMFAVPGLKNTKPVQAVTKVVGEELGLAGQALKQGAQKVTPAPVQRMVGNVVEAIAPGTTNMPGKTPIKTLAGPQLAPYAQPLGQVPPVAPVVAKRGSVGAAATPDAAIIQQALTTATPEFQQLYSNMPLDKVNTPVVLRHLEGDLLDVPVRLTEGQATGDLVKISNEQNLRAKNPEYAYRFQEQNQNLIDNLQARRDRAAPDVYAPKTIDSSQAIIESYKTLDKDRNAAIDAKFTELRNKSGGELPVDSKTLLNNVDKTLSKELLLTDGQGISQYRELKTLADSGSMSFDQYLSMRRNLSRLSAEAKDGNVRQAARLMVQELDKLPLANETAALKPIADQARSLAKARFDALRKDPAYKAAVNDAVPADKFFDKFVINGHNKNVNTMIDTLGRDSPAHQHIKAGTINWLSDRAGVVDGRGNFSQANYNKAVKRLDDVNNFGAIFEPESQLKLKTLGNVANYTQFQPRGTFVNNSNTAVTWLANRAEQAGNVVGLGKYGLPVGTIVRQKIKAAKEKSAVEKSLEPGAGSTLQDISQKGQK